MMVADASTMPIWKAAEANFVVVVARQRRDRVRAVPRRALAGEFGQLPPSLTGGFPAPSGSAPRSCSSRRPAWPARPWRRGRPPHREARAGPGPAVDQSTAVRRMLLAWKNAHRLEASTFWLMERRGLRALAERLRAARGSSAITAISSAIFLLAPWLACSACSACSMLSCAPTNFSPCWTVSTIDRTPWFAQVASGCDDSVSGLKGALTRADAPTCRRPAGARYERGDNCVVDSEASPSNSESREIAALGQKMRGE